MEKSWQLVLQQLLTAAELHLLGAWILQDLCLEDLASVDLLALLVGPLVSGQALHVKS